MSSTAQGVQAYAFRLLALRPPRVVMVSTGLGALIAASLAVFSSLNDELYVLSFHAPTRTLRDLKNQADRCLSAAASLAA